MIAIPSAAPFNPGTTATFYKDVPYGVPNRARLDVWRPDVEGPSPVVVAFHGGGFMFGSKESYYASGTQEEIGFYLAQGYTFINVEYSFIGRNYDAEGVKKCYEDAEAALLWMVQNAEILEIDVNKIALMGGSAGAGIVQQMAFNNIIPNILGIAITEIQSTYNFYKWESIFSVYNFDLEEATLRYGSASGLFNFINVRSMEELQGPEGLAYMADIDTLAVLGNFAGSIWVSNTVQQNTEPFDVGHLYHHPLQAKAVYDQALAENVSVIANIPELNIINATTRQDFIEGILEA